MGQPNIEEKIISNSQRKQADPNYNLPLDF